MRHSATARRRRVTGLVAVVVAVASHVAVADFGFAAQAESFEAGAERVTLEVTSSTPGGLGSAAAVTLANGGELLGDAPGLLLVSIPQHARQRLVEVVDGEVRPPALVDVRPHPGRTGEPTEVFGATTGEQVSVTNAEPWHLAGLDGSGIRIGVIDFFDVATYWNVDEHGPLPTAGVTARCFDSGNDCTDEFFDGVDLGGEEHGIAVVEVIRDMAPGAEILIGQASTASDYDELVDWFVANQVQIVNRSLGSRFDGPGDGRGTLDEIVSDAVSRGILWVNSGGNNAANHYYRHQVRLVGDRIAFGPSGSDPYLPFSGCVALGGVRWANDWDTPAGDRTDYDIYLWESPTGDPDAGSPVASSTRDQRNGADPIELLNDTYCPGPGMTLYLEARWLGGDISGDVLEVLDYGAGIAVHTQAASSAAVSIVDSDDRGVIAVGAIDPPDGGVIGAYSSQGPTNDGGLAPDVAAPSGFFNTVYNGAFAGTSASSPVVAGAAALLLDAGLAVNPPTLGDLIRNFTIDRGQPGADDVYGHGEFRLPDPPPATGLDTTPSRFVALDVPARFLDTRPQTAVGPAPLIGEVWAGELLELPILGHQGIPSSGVTAVVANLVTVEPDSSSYLQALPTRLAGLGAYSNINADGRRRSSGQPGGGSGRRRRLDLDLLDRQRTCGRRRARLVRSDDGRRRCRALRRTHHAPALARHSHRWSGQRAHVGRRPPRSDACRRRPIADRQPRRHRHIDRLDGAGLDPGVSDRSVVGRRRPDIDGERVAGQHRGEPGDRARRSGRNLTDGQVRERRQFDERSQRRWLARGRRRCRLHHVGSGADVCTGSLCPRRAVARLRLAGHRRPDRGSPDAPDRCIQRCRGERAERCQRCAVEHRRGVGDPARVRPRLGGATE